MNKKQGNHQMIRRMIQGSFLLLSVLWFAGCGGESTSQEPSGVDFKNGQDLAKGIPSPTETKRQSHLPKIPAPR